MCNPLCPSFNERFTNTTFQKQEQHNPATLAPPTSTATLWALGEALVLPVVELFLVVRLLLVLLLAPIRSVIVMTSAGPAVTRLTGCRFGLIALVVGQVGHCLGEGEQHLALDAPPLGPGTACPAAGLPGTRDEAEERGGQTINTSKSTKMHPFWKTNANKLFFFFFHLLFIRSQIETCKLLVLPPFIQVLITSSLAVLNWTDASR